MSTTQANPVTRTCNGTHDTRQIFIALVLMLCLLIGLSVASDARAQAAPGLHVSGAQLLNGSGQPVVLRGINRSGTEFMCIQGRGIFDGPNVLNDDSQVPLFASWGANEVNLGINPDCWLGINGVPSAYGGQNYINAIVHETQTLESYGITPVVSQFWDAPGTQQATGILSMTENDHAPALWQSIANTFKGDSRVAFRLYEEPHPAGNTDGTSAWQCWHSGDVQYDTSNTLVPVSRTANCSEGYTVVGMQSLVNIVRGAGANNVIQLSGVQYANSMTHFLDSAYRVSDPLASPQLMGVVDTYPPAGSLCGSTTCYQTEYLPVMNVMPFMAGEFGENDSGGECTTTGVDALMGYFDQHGAGYSGWSWNLWGGCEQLITDYNGTPTGVWGNDLKSHLLSLADSRPTPTSTGIPTLTSTPTPTATSFLTATPTATAFVANTPTTLPTVSPTATTCTFRGHSGKCR